VLVEVELASEIVLGKVCVLFSVPMLDSEEIDGERCCERWRTRWGDSDRERLGGFAGER